MLGWVCQVLQSGILQVQDDQLSPSEKIEACAAVNKASPSFSSRAFISAWLRSFHLFLSPRSDRSFMCLGHLDSERPVLAALH